MARDAGDQWSPVDLSVICYANATVSLRLGHGAGLTAPRAVIQHRAAASLPFRGGKPLRQRRADEGIGPYKVQRKIGEAGGQSRPPLQGAMQDQKNGALVSVWQKMSVTR